jgi:hypothetical protein
VAVEGAPPEVVKVLHDPPEFFTSITPALSRKPYPEADRAVLKLTYPDALTPTMLKGVVPLVSNAMA